MYQQEDMRYTYRNISPPQPPSKWALIIDDNIENKMSKTEPQKSKPIILVNKNEPQFFDFDQPLMFSDPPFEIILSIELSTNDQKTLISTETSGLYTNQIRTYFSNRYTFNIGDTVQLNFKSLYAKFAQDYLLNIPCTIIEIDKFATVSHAILSFDTKNASPDFLIWYQKWFLVLKKSDKSEFINQKSFSFIYHYYKRIYGSNLTHPLLLSDPYKVCRAFVSEPSSACVTFTKNDNTHINFPINVIEYYIKASETEKRIPLYVWFENDQINYFSNTDHPKASSKQIVSWLQNKAQWRVLLVCTRKISHLTELQLGEANQYVEQDIVTHGQSVVESFSTLTHSTGILDISCLFSHLNLPASTLSFTSKDPVEQDTNISYHPLSFKTKRIAPRYTYETKITLTTNDNTTLHAVASDLSLLGLRISFPVTNHPFQANDALSIDFIDWNAHLSTSGSLLGSLLKRKESLEATKYSIINITKNNGFTVLGLKRNKRETDPKLNSFIQHKLAEIALTEKGQYHNNLDLYQSLISNLWVNHNITGLPFFLNRDEDGTRIIQAIINTRENAKLRQPYLKNNDWSFLQQIATPLGLAIRKTNSEKNKATQINIGLYCYYDQTCTPARWKTETDLDFKSVDDKSQFIKSALQHKDHFFYHCSLTPLTLGKDDILNGDSKSFVSIAAHRLKEIHDICNSLIAIGELNDMTRLVHFLYKT